MENLLNPVIVGSVASVCTLPVESKRIIIYVSFTVCGRSDWWIATYQYRR